MGSLGGEGGRQTDFVSQNPLIQNMNKKHKKRRSGWNKGWLDVVAT